MKNILACFLTFVVIGFGVSASFAGTYISGNLSAVIVNDSDIDDGFDRNGPPILDSLISASPG